MNAVDGVSISTGAGFDITGGSKTTGLHFCLCFHIPLALLKMALQIEHSSLLVVVALICFALDSCFIKSLLKFVE
jgi:hypothetical protein